MTEETQKTIKTVSGHEVVYKTDLRGRDIQKMRNALTASSFGGDRNSESLEAWEKVMAEAVLVSVDGTTENLYETLLDLPAKDYEEVFSLLTSVGQPISDEEKKV